MKVLMLVNWDVKKVNEKPTDMQSPDYDLKGEKYWFFKHVEEEVSVDVVGIGHSWLTKFEKKCFRFYIWQTLKVLFSLNKYDVVLSHGAQSGIFLAFIRRFFKGKYKHVLIDVGAFRSASENNSFADKLTKFASKSIDGVIYHQSSQIQYYKEYYPWIVDKSRFIHYGEDIEYFNCNLNENKEKYIVCVGYNKRDWNTLIEAYCELKTDFKLLLLGKKIIIENENIISYEFMPINTLIEYIRGATIGILPLDDMNYSYGQMTFLQQGLLGLPMIVSKSRSLLDYGIDNVTCLFYEPLNAGDLKDKLSILLNNTHVRDKIKSNNINHIKTYLSSEKMCRSIYSYLKEIVNND